MQLSWIDGLFFFVFAYFFLKGWTQGFVYLSASVFSFLVSLYIALRYAVPVSAFITYRFHVDALWASVLSYFLVAFITEAIVSEILSRMISGRGGVSFINRLLGGFVSAGGGLILLTLSFFLLLLIPLRADIKEYIRDSTVATVALSMLDRYGGPLPRVLDESAKNLTRFMTIEPKSDERIPLNIAAEKDKLTVDPQSEAAMLEEVNKERESRGIAPVKLSLGIQEVARLYSKTMLSERFFAHTDLEGKNVGDRLRDSGIHFLIAGENLAYAPDVIIAHQGLMESEGHKKNILDPEFTRIGVGVVDAGIWGKMFTQIFAD